jgi:hypothetical protein
VESKTGIIPGCCYPEELATFRHGYSIQQNTCCR